jgi:hypothetical protein
MLRFRSFTDDMETLPVGPVAVLTELRYLFSSLTGDIDTVPADPLVPPLFRAFEELVSLAPARSLAESSAIMAPGSTVLLGIASPSTAPGLCP